MLDAKVLHNIGILVTRPAHQAESLCVGIEQQGGHAVRFPVLEILEPQDPGAFQDVIEHLDSFDWAIFISINAVEKALKEVLAKRPWPSSLRIAAIGKSSAEGLLRLGYPVDLVPVQRFDSEGLLAEPEMHQVAGQKMVIFRGEGGREHLANALRERGAKVVYAAAYQRARPQLDPAPVLAEWAKGAIDIVLVNSVESLNNLALMLGNESSAGRQALLRTPLLVVSERVAAEARAMGFQHAPLVADNASDEAVLKALVDWQKRSVD